jgi:hypothetical protein
MLSSWAADMFAQVSEVNRMLNRLREKVSAGSAGQEMR